MATLSGTQLVRRSLGFQRSRFRPSRRIFCSKSSTCYHKEDTEAWKYKSNYFNNAWNRQTYGAVEHASCYEPRQQLEQRVPNDTDVENEAFWVQTIAEKASKNRDRAENMSFSNLEHAIFEATAALDLSSGEPDQVGDSNSSTSVASGYDTFLAVSAAQEYPTSRSLPTPATQAKKRKKMVAMRLKQIKDTFSQVKNPLFREAKKPLEPAMILKEDFKTIRLPRTRRYTPSVTKILKDTMPVKNKLALQAWEERMISQMGREKFDLMQKTTLLRGHRLHKFIEDYFDTSVVEVEDGDDAFHLSLGGGAAGSDRQQEVEEEEDQVSLNHVASVQEVLRHFRRPALALESQVFHPTLNYVGYLDAVAVFSKKSARNMVLVDWKTSNKSKVNLAETYDAPIQVAAYAGALNHDSRYPGQVTSAKVVVVYNDGRPANVISMTKRQLEKYWKEWLKRLAVYYRIQQFNEYDNDQI